MLQVKVFDCQHELDLEEEINLFLEKINEEDIFSIEYTTHFLDGGEKDTIYSFSAMILYRIRHKES